MKTLRQELNRRSIVEAQMKDLLDAAARPMGDDLAGMANLGRAWLYSEMYEKNELTKARYNDAIAGLVSVLEARIRSVGGL